MEKKIRSPTPAAIAATNEKMRGRFFLQNPQGPALMIWRAYQKFAVRKCREWRLKMDLNKRSRKKEKYGQGTQPVLECGKRLNEERMKRLQPLTCDHRLKYENAFK